MEIVSIIIPVFNADKYINRCLSVLQELDYPKDKYEIIIVDNGSADKTIEIAEKYPVQSFVLPKVTISRLRNFGGSKAKGDYLAFIDADCIAPSSWLKKSIELLKDKRVGAVGSWYQLPPKTRFLERVWDAHMSFRRLKMGDIDWVPSGNLIVSKIVYQKIGGFNEALTTSEDVDICDRIHKAGFSILTHPDLAVIHLGESKDLKQFLLKEKWRGEGVLQNCFREFPNIKFNKAIAFAGVTLLAMVGILLSFTAHNYPFLDFSLLLLFFIPLYLTIKACMQSRQWEYCIPLIFLFLVYAMARILSAFNLRVWKK
jgi:glycosyltransferase involved in cell wall biosynthesis